MTLVLSCRSTYIVHCAGVHVCTAEYTGVTRRISCSWLYVTTSIGVQLYIDVMRDAACLWFTQWSNTMWLLVPWIYQNKSLAAVMMRDRSFSGVLWRPTGQQAGPARLESLDSQDVHAQSIAVAAASGLRYSSTSVVNQPRHRVSLSDLRCRATRLLLTSRDAAVKSNATQYY